MGKRRQEREWSLDRRLPVAERHDISMTEKRTAVVTGGSRGIGRAIALKLSLLGYEVCIVYAGNESAAKETIRLAKEAGNDRMLAVQADISTAEGAALAMETAAKELGQIDVLVNNAGITRDGLLIAMKEEDFDRVLQVNLKGTFLCCKAVCRGMIKRRSGRIINLSSIVGIHGNAGQVNYAASKAGVIGLTKSLAKEIAGRGVTVNAVAPGMIETDMTAALTEEQKKSMLAAIPAKRIGKPEDVEAAVAFLASKEASYITGQVLGVDGGM